MKRSNGQKRFVLVGTIYPKKRPPFETAFIFCEESCETAQVPPWAIRLILPREDLEVDAKDMKDARFVWAEDEV